ncbi:hypothetical protein D3C72_1390880 [compost metagenome]
MAGPAGVERSAAGDGKAADIDLRQAYVKIDGRVHVLGHLRRGFAQLPQAFGLLARLGNYCVHHLARLHGFAQGGFHRILQAGLVLAVHIDQRQERVLLGKGGLELLPLHRGLHEIVPHQLERRHAVAKARLHARQHRQGLVKPRHGYQTGGLGLRRGA